jgi:hypothetical protein
MRRMKHGRRIVTSADAKRFKRLPPRVNVRNTVASHPVSPARDPYGGRDTDRDFTIRYGDSFDG